LRDLGEKAYGVEIGFFGIRARLLAGCDAFRIIVDITVRMI
jgi:hypothetical protein